MRLQIGGSYERLERWTGRARLFASVAACAVALLALVSCVNPLLKLAPASVSPPTISPGGGVFGTDQSVSLASTVSGATIYYTTDGTTPTASSTKYSGAIPVAGNGTQETIEAIAVAGGKTSAVVTAAFTINYSIGGSSTVASPVFSPTAGVYSAAPTGGVTLSDTTSGASIYYTTNGTTPSASNGTLYSGPITIANTNGTTTTVRAVATESGVISSPIVSASYAINFGQVSTPQLSVGGGVYTADQTGIVVTVPSAPSGTTIYYTMTSGTVGAAPTTSSTVYTGPLSVTGSATAETTETIEVMATAPNYKNSTIASAIYVINYPPLTAPTFSPTPGAYLNNQTGITIAVPSAPSGTVIYYTATSGYAGTAPTTSSSVFATSTPLTVTGTGSVETFEAMAQAPGYTQSAVTVAVFAISVTTMPFTSSGTFVVPFGATQLVAKLWGGGGGAGDKSGGAGGGGGYATQTIAVTGGQQFTVTVGGGAPPEAPCSSGLITGGLGGGMSAIGDSSGYYAIAGGGGGGGFYPGGSGGGAGGQNGATDSAGDTGGSEGSNGTGSTPVSGGTGGAGGTAVSGGYNGGAGGATGGGYGGGGTYSGYGGSGYGGGGGGSSIGPPASGGGGGGNYGASYKIGNGPTPGNSTDPNLPAGDAVGGTPSTSCSAASTGGPGFVYIQVS